MLVEEEFIYAGKIKDTSPYAVQKLRLDGRLIGTDIQNTTLDSGQKYVLLDMKEQGELLGFRVVADNPYLEVFIEIDDWRYTTTIAELLLQPDTGRMHSNFYAVKGDNPLSGYALVFSPDFPESYEKRVRIVLSNNIKKAPSNSSSSEGILGAGVNIKGKGNQPTPTTSGTIGGVVRTHPVYLTMQDFNTHLGGNGIERLGGLGLHFDLFNQPHANLAVNSAKPIKRGILHPYVGKAGEVHMSTQKTMEPLTAEGARGSIHVFFDDPFVGEASNQTSTRPQMSLTRQDIYIVDFADTGSNNIPHALQTGDRLGFKDEDRYYFVGQIDAEEPAVTLPAKFAKNGSSEYVRALKLSVIPGMNPAPPSIVIPNDGGRFESQTSGYFTITGVAETNPKIHIRTAEIKRRKQVSLDG